MEAKLKEIVERLIEAIKPDDVVLGGGNAKKLKGLPPGTRLGDNANAFIGGLRLWEDGVERPRSFAWAPNRPVTPQMALSKENSQ